MVEILDSTLREGEQTPGVYFDNHVKLAIAELLDNIGINYIEAGHPKVTEEIHQAVKILSHRGLNANIAAHSRLVKSDIDLALESGVDFIGIFYSVTDDRLSNVFKTDINQVAEKIYESISYAKSKKPDILIRYTPEDTVRSDFEKVIIASEAAVKAGADVISIADTTGYMAPGTNNNLYDYVVKLREALNANNLNPKIAVHCHNDQGLALANAIDAYRAGVDIIDASVMGLGERAGIVDLAQLLVVLNLNFNEQNWNLSYLDELYKLVSFHSGIPIPANFPILGKNAFTHCAGVHTHAAAINPMHYEHLNPELVNRERKFSLDHMSGIASLNFALKQLGLESLTDKEKFEILSEIKKIGQKGRTVELSELSLIIESEKLINKKQIRN